ncbi:neuralized-like protein 4 [Styela clava]
MTNAQKFHRRTGRLVELSKHYTSAGRKHAKEEFNDGMIFSENPLKANELFTICIDKKIASWSGSIEIGLVATDPSKLVIPKGAIAIRHGSWFISGTSVNIDGVATIDDYCQDLDSLDIGDTVGIMRNDNNQVHLYINGADQGVAAVCIYESVWAMVNLYGKCAGVTIVSDSTVSLPQVSNLQDSLTFSEVLFDRRNRSKMLQHQSCFLDGESLVFYAKCGSLIQLLEGGMTAVRSHHQDEFNNGVVMTNRTLKNDELFEIKLNALTDKWSGSIEMGVTTHAPDLLEIPSTMTNLRSGTVMLSGCGIITNGKGSRKHYLDFHLDELKVGDHIGLMRKEEGTLHFFINGVDQGVAANNIPPHIYGVVDLYGRAVSVSIVPHHSVFERSRRNNAVVDRILLDSNLLEEREPLLFDVSCGKHIELSSCKKSAMRQNPLEDFNHAVVLSARTLNTGETFTVKVEDVVEKWSGSLEIGITTYPPEALNFPATMTNVRSGTWIMTATGVMVNGVTVVDDYGTNVDNMSIGDTLGVCRKSNGNLHFYMNGIDQGLAAKDVPENIYAVVDLYGQVSKVTIVDSLVDWEYSMPVPINDPTGYSLSQQAGLKLNSARTHVCIMEDGSLSAHRKNPNHFFDGSVIVMDKKLTVGEVCEFEINEIVPYWSGSFELGVTSNIDLHSFPSSLVDMEKNIFVWTGRSLFENGQLVKDNFAYDTENLKSGSRIGIMLNENGDLQAFYDGLDIGVIFSHIKKCSYPVINLYGKCARITFLGKGDANLSHEMEAGISPKSPLEISPCIVLRNNHRFFDHTDGSYVFLNENRVVIQKRLCNEMTKPPIIFSARPLKVGEVFEVLINDSRASIGSIVIGAVCLKYTSLFACVSNTKTLEDLQKLERCCLISAQGVTVNGTLINEFYCPDLYTLDHDDRVGIMLGGDETLQLLYNGQAMGKIACNFLGNELPYVVICLGTRISCLEVVKNAANIKEMKAPPSLSDSSSEDDDDYSEQAQTASIPPTIQFFSKIICGKNVRVSEDGLVAMRVGSYNQAIVATAEPLRKNALFQVKVKNLNGKWKSTLSIGVSSEALSKVKLAIDALKIAKQTWLIQGDSVFKNGIKLKDNYGPGLDTITVCQTIGICVDEEKNLRLFVDGEDQGIAATDVPESIHAIVELYGSCDKIEVTEEMNLKNYKEPTNGLGECSLPSTNIMCLYQSSCSKYLKALKVPEEFFTGVVSCFCNACFKSKKDLPGKCQSEFSNSCPQPVGWCSFGLRTHPNVDLKAVSKHWTVAFCNTKASDIRKLLDCGEVPIENTPVYDMRCKSNIEDAVAKKKIPVIISPSLKLVTDEKSGLAQTYNDDLSKKGSVVQLALQLYIQPDSFKERKISPCKLETQADCESDAVEWMIKQPGTTIFSHLLLKLVEK